MFVFTLRYYPAQVVENTKRDSTQFLSKSLKIVL